jgi:hypothetical protein
MGPPLIGRKLQTKMTYSTNPVRWIDNTFIMYNDEFMWGNLHVSVCTQNIEGEKRVSVRLSDTPYSDGHKNHPKFEELQNAVRLYRDNPGYAGMNLAEFVVKMVGDP